MKAPVPLSAGARELLELGSHVEPPTPEQCERMDRALLPLLASGRAASGAGRALLERRALGPELISTQPRGVRASLPRGLKSTFGAGTAKLVLALGALTATAAAAFWLGRLSSAAPTAIGASDSSALALAPRATAPVAVQAATSADAHASPPSTIALEPAVHAPVALAPVVLAPVAPSPQLTSAAVATPVGMTRAAHAPKLASSAVDLGAEIEQLARAEAALRQGRAGAALAQLQRRAVRHLIEQASALEAIAHCEIDGDSGRDRARTVLQRWPTSAFVARVRDACGL